MHQPLVSVCIITYQHARFIAQAIDAALAQRCDFPIEILIGEDESTDGTREICLDYARRHPDIIRVFLRRRKDVILIDGLPRGSSNFRRTLGEARGEFVALCEGDDFWTDPSKLQRQVDFLRANPDCVGCFHDAQLVDGDGRCIQESYFQEKGDRFTQADVLARLLSRQPTCSMVFRRSAFAEPLPDWYLRRPSDLYLDILITNHGLLGFVRRNMSAYRQHAAGIWSGQREARQVVELIIRYKLLLADSYFIKHYKDILLKKIDDFQSMLFTRADVDGEMARLASIVEEQSGALASMGRVSTESQKHIDALMAQLDQLAATSTAQTKHIKVLEKERDRLTRETAAAKKEAARAVSEGQKHIDNLRNQVDQLAATSAEQTKHIKVLEKERDRLAVEASAAQGETLRASTTSREQSGYIGALEKERHRLSAELAELRKKAADYVAVMKEQADYIKMLEVVRDQNANKTA
jgi:glycosyltransferase involved in cell wall biosynthesis